MHLSAPYLRGCSGFRVVPRRQVLRAGVLGALGISMADLFRLQAEDRSGMTIAGGNLAR